MNQNIPSVEDISSEVLAENTHAYPVAEMLRRIQVIDKVTYEGKTLQILDRDIQDGDLYLTGRNIESGVNGVRLLKAKQVDRENGWILPESRAYPFDIWECVPVAAV